MSADSKTVKITFTGDIMCDRLTVAGYKKPDGTFDFSEMFDECKDYFSQSDFVVGNLETPVANAGYSYKMYDFNAPVEFAEAVKNAGFDLVSTANNHCLDRGVSGLEDTIKALESIGLKHTGTNSVKKLPTGIIGNIGGIKVGFLSYTYGTNAFLNKVYLKNNEKWKVNLFQEQELHNPLYRRFYKSRFGEKFKSITNRLFSRLVGKKWFGPVWERTENSFRLMRGMKKDIRALKAADEKPDYVVMLLHGGGQYNPEPMKRLKKIMAKIAGMGVDAIITNHEHMIHDAVMSSDKVMTYSLGDFVSTSRVHRPPYDEMGQYSVLFNLHLAKNNGVVKPFETTFSIVRKISNGENRVKVVPLFDLINKCAVADERARILNDNLKIYNLFRNSNETDIKSQKEYKL